MTAATAFFTAITQATATIAGLIIGFRAVQYQLEQQRRAENTSQLCSGLARLKDSYRDLVGTDILYSIESAYGDKIEYDTSEARDARIRQLVEVADTDAFNPRKTERFRAHEDIPIVASMGYNRETLNGLARELNTITWLLDQVTGENDSRRPYLLEMGELERLERATRNASVLYTEFVNDMDGSEFTPHWAEHKSALMTLHSEAAELTTTGRNSTLQPPVKMSTTLWMAAILLLIGVFLPLAVLTTPPESIIPLSARHLFYLQVLILGGAGILVLGLLIEVLSGLGEDIIVIDSNS